MSPWFTALPFFHYLDFKPKEVYHSARFEKDSRYYILRLEKDLLEDWTITAINGRIKSKVGQSRTHAFPSFADAYDFFCDMAKLRYQRHYYLKNIASEEYLFRSLLHFWLHIEMSESQTRDHIKANAKLPMLSSSLKAKRHQAAHNQMNFSF